MEENTSTKNESSCFNFWLAVKAGFLGTLALVIVMYLLGQNVMLFSGALLAGSAASISMQYLVGGLFTFAVGIIYGLIYALIFAPMHFNAVLKALIYSVILAIIAVYMMPKLPGIVSKIKGEMHQEQKQNASETALAPISTENEAPANPLIPQTPEAKKAMIMSWINHFIYALVLAVTYRRRRCY